MIKNIEAKLEAGTQQFSAQEVAYLLNVIRVHVKGTEDIMKSIRGNK